MSVSPEIKNVLMTINLSQHLTANELDILVEHSHILSSKAEDIILQQGKMSPGLYIIIEGTVLVNIRILGDGATNLAKLGRGSFLGEISVIEREPCAASVVAETDLQLLFINNTYFEMLEFFPETKYKILRAITSEVCLRLHQINKKIKAIIQESAMSTESLFSSVKKSLTKTTLMTLEEAKIDFAELRQEDVFANFSAEEVNILLEKFELISAPRQCYLIHEGDESVAFYIVLRGAVQSSIVYDGKVAKLSVLGPLSFFVSNLATESCNSAIFTYSTCERAILLQIPQQRLEQLQQEHLALWYKLFELICKSIIGMARACDKLDIRLNSELYNR